MANSLIQIPSSGLVPPTSNAATQVTKNDAPGAVLIDGAKTILLSPRLIMPKGYAGEALSAQLSWNGDATTGAVRWSVEVEAWTGGTDNTDVNTSDGWDSENLLTATAPGTPAGRPASAVIPLTFADSVQAGDWFRLRISRLGADAADTMTAAAYLFTVDVSI